MIPIQLEGRQDQNYSVAKQSHSSSERTVSVNPSIARRAFDYRTVLNEVMRDYQPIWRIRSRMSPL
jgi:hypothetical protein